MSPRTKHYSRTVLRTALVWLGALAHIPSVHAVERERPGAHALRARLDTAADAELLTLLDQLPEVTSRLPQPRAAAALAVAEVLGDGHSDAVTDRALETLAELAAPEAAPVLSQFAQHRRAAARAHAFTALSRVAGRDAKLRNLVASGLRDSSAEVRAASARALETLHASEFSELLLRAFGRGVPEAAVTLGSVGDAKSLEAFSAHLKQQPLEVMLAGYQRYLLRPDLPDKPKLEVVARLEGLAGPVVLRFLSTLAREAHASPALKSAALTSSARIARALPRAAAGGQP